MTRRPPSVAASNTPAVLKAKATSAAAPDLGAAESNRRRHSGMNIT